MTHQDLPAQFGRYRILKKLGGGGMGAVYLAHDPQLDRSVALKVPHFSDDSGPAVIERFKREARIAARIDHPNLCAVYDVGEVGGVHFLTMPYVEGTPLARSIDAAAPWPPPRAAELVSQLALAVALLHERGIIHRDLKPSNIILRPTGAPVLLDFGLARSYTAQSQRLTTLGAPLGTPAYMSPEQVNGNPEAIGPASDVYSLGMILYELVTGQLPFEGPPLAVFAQILHTVPAPPSRLRPQLDPSIDAICLKALSKKPEGRYPTANALAAALLRYNHMAGGLAPAAPVPVTDGLARNLGAADSRVPCPHCGKTVHVPASMAGRKLKCPRCWGSLAEAAQTQPPQTWDRSGETAPPSASRTAADLDLVSPTEPPENTRPRPIRAPRSRPEEPRGSLPWLGMGLAGCLLLSGGLIVWAGLRNGQQADADTPAAVAPEQTGPKKESEPPKEQIVPPAPVALRLLPLSAVTLAPGQRKTLTLKVKRGQFPGPVEVRLATGPPGVTVRNGLVAADAVEGSLELAVAAGVPSGDYDLRLLLIANARVEEKLRLTVSPPPSFTLRPLKPLELEAGRSLVLPISVTRRGCLGAISVELSGAASGVTIRKGRVEAGARAGNLEIVVAPDAAPGRRTLQLRAHASNASTLGQLDVTVRARPGASGSGFGGSNLLGNKSVQDELKLTAGQKEKADELSRKVIARLREETAGTPSAERLQKLQTAMKAVNEEISRELAGLLSADQARRYRQIQVQAMGLRAFSDEYVQAVLKLTDEQTKRIKEIVDEVGKKVQEETKDLSGRDRFTKLREVREKRTREALSQIDSTLSSRQKSAWKALTGEKFLLQFGRKKGSPR